MKRAALRKSLIHASAWLLAITPASSVAADETGTAPGAPAWRAPASIAPPPVRPAVAAPLARPAVAAPLAAAASPEQTSRLLREAALLRPGEFVWRPELAPQGAVVIVVSIPLQRAFVYRAETLIGVTTVSTGRRGHPTPVGSFAIMEKRRTHFSNLYNNAPMPFMQRLTWGGIALHAGRIPANPASHGCIRLPLAFARSLFAVTAVGGAVHVTDRSPTPAAALATVRANGATVAARRG